MTDTRVHHNVYVQNVSFFNVGLGDLIIATLKPVISHSPMSSVCPYMKSTQYLAESEMGHFE